MGSEPRENTFTARDLRTVHILPDQDRIEFGREIGRLGGARASISARGDSLDVQGSEFEFSAPIDPKIDIHEARAFAERINTLAQEAEGRLAGEGSRQTASAQGVGGSKSSSRGCGCGTFVLAWIIIGAVLYFGFGVGKNNHHPVSAASSTTVSRSSTSVSTSEGQSGSASSQRSLAQVKADAVGAVAAYGTLLIDYVNYDTSLDSCLLSSLADTTGAAFIRCARHARTRGDGAHLSSQVNEIALIVAHDPQCQRTGNAINQAVQQQLDAIVGDERQLELGAKTTSDFSMWAIAPSPASNIQHRIQSAYSPAGALQRAVRSAFSSWEVCLRQHASA
jgi:hypothetical protein